MISETAEIRLSVAADGDKTAAIVLVSAVPSGFLKSPSHPFIDMEHDINLRESDLVHGTGELQVREMNMELCFFVFVPRK